MPDEVGWKEVLRAALVRAGRAAHPREFAAVLGGDRGGRATWVSCFVEVPNTARCADAFAVEPPAFAAAERELRRRGCAFVGFAHSHPRGVAAPAARDRAELWTECVQVITSADDVRAYWLDARRTAHALTTATVRAAR